MKIAKYLECLLLLEHTFLPKLFFPEGMGGVQNSSGNSRGVGGYFSGQKLEILARRGGYMKFSPWWGYGYFLELHINMIELINRTKQV